MGKGSCKASALLAFCWLALFRDAVADNNRLDTEVVITGTRIIRDGYAATTPVTVALAEDLLKVNPGNLPDALNKLPEFQLSSSPARSTHNFANSASNSNILNLRGVGGIRTLVLFDGLRVAPTSYRGEVDVDVLPKLLLERVDIVTAGASSAYGSDAVAGVVNFVLDHKFSGVKGVAQVGRSQRGDNEQHRFGIATGFDVLDAGHLLLSAELYKHEGMLRSERTSGRQNYTFAGNTGIGAPGSITNPLVVYSGVTQNIASEYGQIVGPANSPYRNYRFAADGTLAPFMHGAATGTPGYEIGGDGFAIPADNTAVAPSDTHQLFARFDLPFNDAASAFIQASYANNRLSYSSLANSFIAPTNATLFNGNPYLPAAIQNSFTGSNDFISLARYGGTEPKPFTVENTHFFMATSGVGGNFADGWRWSTAYTRSESTHKVEQRNIWDFRRAYAALDAVRDSSGRIVCNATLSADAELRRRYADCQPLNPLLNGVAFTSQPGYGYATGRSRYAAKLAQDSVVATVTGSPLSLPAGPIDFAAGAEYRRQVLRLDSNADPALLDTQAERDAYFAGLRGVSAQTPAYWLTNVGTADGRAQVTEAFSELNAPLTSELQLNGALRLTNYQTSGSVTTWKLGTQWSPMTMTRLRATYSSDIRAPSLFELYAGPQQGIGLLIDPRSGKTGNVNSIAGGNPQLQPERANTLTFGAVFSPPSIPDLTVSLDYYRMRIRDQIGTLSITQIAQNCFANAAAPECALIDQADGTQLPTAIRVVPANIAFLETSGIDMDASWRGKIAGGKVSLRLYASYLESFRTQQSSSAPIYEFAGYGQTANQPIGRPRLRGMLNFSYSRDTYEVFVSQQFISGLTVGSQEPNQNYNGLSVGSVSYTDLTGSWRTPALSGRMELFLTVNNLFDRNPPLIPGTIPGLNSPTIISLYDVVGRAFIGGARVNF